MCNMLNEPLELKCTYLNFCTFSETKSEIKRNFLILFKLFFYTE